MGTECIPVYSSTATSILTNTKESALAWRREAAVRTNRGKKTTVGRQKNTPADCGWNAINSELKLRQDKKVSEDERGRKNVI